MSYANELHLGDRPKIVSCRFSEHGRQGREAYKLPKLWCLHLYFYEVEMEVGGRPIRILPGAVTVIPPQVRIIYKYPNKRHRHFFVHFKVNRKDPAVFLPLMQHLPEASAELLDRLENMKRIFAQNTFHAEILFWSLLWDLSEAGRKQKQPQDRGAAVIRAVEALVEEGLPKRILASEVADHLGISAGHINRVIKSRLGMTTIQLINKRRLERACHLLLHSTIPVKLIAAECGVEDLQQFNKLIRAEYGKGPRQLRNDLSSAGEATWVNDRV